MHDDPHATDDPTSSGAESEGAGGGRAEEGEGGGMHHAGDSGGDDVDSKRKRRLELNRKVGRLQFI